MSARALVLGLDGADVEVIEAMGPSLLPNIHRLMHGGVWSRLQSVQPPATLPNWTTFLTGADPGEHGVFDFTLRQDYRLRFTGGTIRALPTITARLDKLGMRCAQLFFPATWPPERLEHGICVSGWDSPVAFEADASYVWPPQLDASIRARFGPLRFDQVNEFDADKAGWHGRLADALVEAIEHKTRLIAWLLKSQQWDLFSAYFGESDTASHHLWSLWDAASPRHLPGRTMADQRGLERVYHALDASIATLVELAGDDCQLTLLSDHGFGGASAKVLYLNRVLSDAGLLRFKSAGPMGPLTSALKDAALTRLPGRMKQALFSVAGRALPGWLESRARFSAIDMNGTVAFSDELNYFPAIHYNLRGRESRGQVDQSERAGLQARIEEALYALRDPWTGKRVVRHVWPREQLYEGPHLERAPDLLLDLHLDPRRAKAEGPDTGCGGYSYNLMPTSTAPKGTGSFRKLSEGEYLGRKGRSLPGSHRSRGLFIALGPQITGRGEVHASMADVTATLLARLGIRASAVMTGRVLREALGGQQRSDKRVLPAWSKSEGEMAPISQGGNAEVEARLRSLGYFD